MRRMSHAWRGVGLLLMTTCVAICAAADEPQFDQARLDLIPQRMNQFVQDGQISGAVTLIATHDRVVHVGVVGKADIAAGRDMQADTIFRIASMTKNVTAVALMQLVEQGRVKVDDEVAKYISAFAQQRIKQSKETKSVTIREILAHTAGLYRPDAKETAGKSLAEIVDLIASYPLEFQPGTKWEYSSGLTVAGRLIEVISGESYADYLKKHIFDPLEMNDTTFVLTPDQARRLAKTYKPGAQPGTLEAVEISDPTIAKTPNPSGGLFSTASDMTKFYQAILRGRREDDRPTLLKPTALSLLRANFTQGLVTGFTPGNYWGLGWCVVEKPQGVTRLLSPGTFGHGGAWGTQGWIDPDRGLVLILMMQRSDFGNSDGSDVRDAFTELVLQAHRGYAAHAGAKYISYHGHSAAIELRDGNTRAIIGPQAGGRVLEFSVDDAPALWLDDKEKDWKPGQPAQSSAGRFDFGPELTVPKHPLIWSGEWTAEITKAVSVRLISPRDEAAGVQLIRDFELLPAPMRKIKHYAMAPKGRRLMCRQTIVNISKETREYCHWGRSFSPGGGICVIPLAGQSRFPSKYVMYEDSAIINVRNQDDRIREREGFLEILSPPRKPKLGFDSYAGWLGYVMPNNYVFVKRFETYPDRPYNEAAGLTLSVWYPEGARIELEPIGPRERLKPGEAASFTEDWWLLPFDYPKAGENIDLPKLKKLVEEKTVSN